MSKCLTTKRMQMSRRREARRSSLVCRIAAEFSAVMPFCTASSHKPWHGWHQKGCTKLKTKAKHLLKGKESTSTTLFGWQHLSYIHNASGLHQLGKSTTTFSLRTSRVGSDRTVQKLHAHIDDWCCTSACWALSGPADTQVSSQVPLTRRCACNSELVSFRGSKYTKT